MWWAWHTTNIWVYGWTNDPIVLFDWKFFFVDSRFKLNKRKFSKIVSLQYAFEIIFISFIWTMFFNYYPHTPHSYKFTLYSVFVVTICSERSVFCFFFYEIKKKTNKTTTTSTTKERTRISAHHHTPAYTRRRSTRTTFIYSNFRIVFVPFSSWKTTRFRFQLLGTLPSLHLQSQSQLNIVWWWWMVGGYMCWRIKSC